MCRAPPILYVLGISFYSIVVAARAHIQTRKNPIERSQARKESAPINQKIISYIKIFFAPNFYFLGEVSEA